MPKKRTIIDVIFGEIASAYTDNYYFDEEKFEKLSQKNIDCICTYLINELNILGFDYDTDDGHHFYIFETERRRNEKGR